MNDNSDEARRARAAVAAGMAEAARAGDTWPEYIDRAMRIAGFGILAEFDQPLDLPGLVRYRGSDGQVRMVYESRPDLDGAERFAVVVEEGDDA